MTFIFEISPHNDNTVFIQPTPQSNAWVANLLYVLKNHLTYYEWDTRYSAYKIRFWDCFLVKDGLEKLEMGNTIGVGPRLYDRLLELESYKTATDVGVPLNFNIRPVQSQSVMFAASRTNCFIGHSRGVGKTACGFTTGAWMLHNKKADHVLCVVPRSVISKWEKEIQNFLLPPYNDVVKVYVRSTQAAQKRRALYMKPASFHLVTPETLSKDIDWLMENFPWKKNYIVTDEHHKFKNKNNRRKALLKVRKNSVGILAMSGHDIHKLEQWWNMMELVDPNIFGTYYEFKDKYTISDDWNRIIFYKNQDLLAKKLEQIVFRKEKHEVMPELPDKSYEERIVRLSSKEKKLYKALREGTLELEDKELQESLNNSLPIVRYGKMRRFLCMPSLVSPEFDFESSKMKELRSILEESQKEKIVIFSQWSSTCDAMEQMIGKENCYKITGDSKKTPTEIASAYMRDKKRRVLIMDTAGALGIDLHGYMDGDVWRHGADTIIFLDECFDHAENKQIEDRIHRYIEDEDEMHKWNVTVIRLRANRTVDTHLARILDEDSKSAKRIFNIISGKINMESFTQEELEKIS